MALITLEKNARIWPEKKFFSDRKSWQPYLIFEISSTSSVLKNL